MGSPITVHSEWKMSKIRIKEKDILLIDLVDPFGRTETIVFDTRTDNLTLKHNITFQAQTNGSTIMTNTDYYVSGYNA